MRRTDEGVTLLECLVALTASSIILGGFLGLFFTADLASRGNTSDIDSTAMDYNLDHVLSEIATATSAGATPTRAAYDGQTHSGGDPCQILVYERSVDERMTGFWPSTYGGPASNQQPPKCTSARNNPWPLQANANNRADKFHLMTNRDPNHIPATGPAYAKHWMTGIVALTRFDQDPAPSLRWRTSVLWQCETTMERLAAYRSAGTCLSFFDSGAPGTNGHPPALTAGEVVGIVGQRRAHLTFPGTRILATGVQSFAVTAGSPMTWTVTR